MIKGSIEIQEQLSRMIENNDGFETGILMNVDIILEEINDAVLIPE